MRMKGDEGGVMMRKRKCRRYLALALAAGMAAAGLSGCGGGKARNDNIRKSEIPYVEPVEPCGRDVWHVSGDYRTLPGLPGTGAVVL